VGVGEINGVKVVELLGDGDTKSSGFSDDEIDGLGLGVS
jgi:hypothetical protein